MCCRNPEKEHFSGKMGCMLLIECIKVKSLAERCECLLSSYPKALLMAIQRFMIIMEVTQLIIGMCFSITRAHHMSL